MSTMNLAVKQGIHVLTLTNNAHCDLRLRYADDIAMVIF